MLFVLNWLYTSVSTLKTNQLWIFFICSIPNLCTKLSIKCVPQIVSFDIKEIYAEMAWSREGKVSHILIFVR